MFIIIEHILINDSKCFVCRIENNKIIKILRRLLYVPLPDIFVRVWKGGVVTPANVLCINAN